MSFVVLTNQFSSEVLANNVTLRSLDHHVLYLAGQILQIAGTRVPQPLLLNDIG